MKNTVFLIFVFIIIMPNDITTIKAQNYSSANPTSLLQPSFWLKPRSTNCNINSIIEHSNNHLCLKQVNSTQQPQNIINIINYNPIIRFTSKKKQYLSADNIDDNNILSPTENTIYTVQKVKNNGIIFQFGKYNQSILCAELSNNNIQFSFPKRTKNTTIKYYNRSILSKFCICRLDTDKNRDSLYVNGILCNSILNSEVFETDSNDNKIRIGCTLSNNDTNEQCSDMDLCEIIIFNRKLNKFENNIWESYLGLKYGITINNGKSDYYNSEGKIVWEADSIFKHDIFGIGKDSKKSTNLDIKYAKTNQEIQIRARELFLSGHFIIMAHNNGRSQWCNAGKLPHSERIWKFTNNNRAINALIKINVIKYLHEKELYILIDNNNNWNDGITEYYRIDKWGNTAINIPQGNSYLTIAPSPINSVLKQVTQAPLCEKENIHFKTEVYGGIKQYLYIYRINEQIQESNNSSSFSTNKLKNLDNIEVTVQDKKGSISKDTIKNIEISPQIHTSQIKHKINPQQYHI